MAGESAAQRVTQGRGLGRYRREWGWPVVITVLRAGDMLGPVLARPGRQLCWIVAPPTGLLSRLSGVTAEWHAVTVR